MFPRRLPTQQVRCAPKEFLLGVDVAASIRKNVAFNLRRLMNQAGLNQRMLAQKIGYSESRVSNWMKARNFPEEVAFDALREKMGWTYDQLTRDPDALTAEEVMKAVTSFAEIAGYEVRKRN